MILIALGSNLPFCGASPEELAPLAASALDAASGVVAASRLFSSAAWPDPGDPPFVNAVVAIKWGGDADRLLAMLRRIEGAFGRHSPPRRPAGAPRGEKNAPRTLDLDIIAFNNEVRIPKGHHSLALPHPRLGERDFVLAPLLDVAPNWRHPATGAPAARMLEALHGRTARPLGPAPVWTAR
ncbi:MAG: 2-amino-4-hydroxy-6-hydroxymethyldihydropteridine diphosphokinase [Alphaproteobacteria bacterium]|nr:2-amino-4-hydroxy-6-hydroxymethyldihydropteridine diphosphokinase [Alphaproteobacteria bacterium]